MLDCVRALWKRIRERIEEDVAIWCLLLLQICCAIPSLYVFYYALGSLNFIAVCGLVVYLPASYAKACCSRVAHCWGEKTWEFHETFLFVTGIIIQTIALCFSVFFSVEFFTPFAVKQQPQIAILMPRDANWDNFCASPKAFEAGYGKKPSCETLYDWYVSGCVFSLLQALVGIAIITLMSIVFANKIQKKKKSTVGLVKPLMFEPEA